MKLWGVFHTKESGELNRTPRVICDSKESAEKALKRFPQCKIAVFHPPKEIRDSDSGLIEEGSS